VSHVSSSCVLEMALDNLNLDKPKATEPPQHLKYTNVKALENQRNRHQAQGIGNSLLACKSFSP